MSDLTLAMDGSTYAGSVALISGREVAAERQLDDVEKPGRAGRDELFMPMVASCLYDAGAEPRDISRIVCGEGPGSFTSLRIAASIAKGIAVGTGCPLYVVSSLMLVVAGTEAADGRWLAVIPAMRGEVYSRLFVKAGGSIEPEGDSALLDEELIGAECERLSARAMGPRIGDGTYPHARGVARVLESVVARGPCDLALWEPTYGRLAEAQVKWEAAHGRSLSVAP